MEMRREWGREVKWRRGRGKERSSGRRWKGDEGRMEMGCRMENKREWKRKVEWRRG